MAVDLEFVLDLLSTYGYLIVFLAALAEAFPFVSILVPGQAVVVIAGAAAALGRLDIWGVILVAIPAGIIGDAAGFYLGRSYGRTLLERYGPMFRVGPRHLEKTDQVMTKYGAFALVLFRFSFLTRPIGPLLAGSARMGERKFWTYNVVGAVLWAAAYALLGYFGGVAFLELEGRVGRILTLSLAGAVGVYLLYRFLKRYAESFTRDDFYVALMGSIGGAFAGVVMDRAVRVGPSNRLDIHAAGFIDVLEPFAVLFRLMELLGSDVVLGAASVGVVIYLAARRLRWEAALVGLGMTGVIVMTQALERWLGPQISEALTGTSGGFPSDTASITLVFAGTITYILAAHAKRPHIPMIAASAGGVLSFLAAFAGLAQGAETPSAVFTGIFAGAAWLSVSILFIEFALKRTPKPQAQPAT